MPYSNNIDPNVPQNSEGLSLGAQRIRETRLSLFERLGSFFFNPDADPLVPDSETIPRDALQNDIKDTLALVEIAQANMQLQYAMLPWHSGAALESTPGEWDSTADHCVTPGGATTLEWRVPLRVPVGALFNKITAYGGRANAGSTLEFSVVRTAIADGAVDTVVAMITSGALGWQALASAGALAHPITNSHMYHVYARMVNSAAAGDAKLLGFRVEFSRTGIEMI